MDDENIDETTSLLFPINSKEQKKVVEVLNVLEIGIRHSKIIKQVTYIVKVEYYEKDILDMKHGKD